MAFSGAQITRIGLSGFHRSLYGDFSGKAQSDNPVVETVKKGGSGGYRRHGRKGWWVFVGPDRYKVFSKQEESQLVNAFVQAQEAALLVAEKGTETQKARGLRISLTRTRRRMEVLRQQAHEERMARLRQDDEDLVWLLTLM